MKMRFVVPFMLWSSMVWAQPTFHMIDLGNFIPHAINEKGVMAGSVYNSTITQAAIGKGTSAFSIAKPEWTYSVAYGVNRSNVAIGVWLDAQGVWHPFLWSDSQGAVDLPLPAGTTGGVANAINNAGEIVGTVYTPSGSRAVRWVNGQVEVFDNPGVATSEAVAVNRQGMIVGTITDDEAHDFAAMWGADGTVNVLWDSGGSEMVEASAVNNKGVVVVSLPFAGTGNCGAGTSTGHEPIGLWQNGSLTTLGLPTSTSVCQGYGINNVNWVVGRCKANCGSALGFTAYLWVQGQLYDLNALIDAPLDLEQDATGVNDLGMIVGSSEAGGFLLVPAQMVSHAGK